MMNPEYEKKCENIFRQFCTDHPDIKAIGYSIDVSSPSYIIIKTTIGEIRVHVDDKGYHIEGSAEKQNMKKTSEKWDVGVLPIILPVVGILALFLAYEVDNSIILASGSVIFAVFCAAAPILAALRRIEKRLDDLRKKQKQ